MKITYIVCIYHDTEMWWGVSVNPTQNTAITLREHLKKYEPAAEFIRAEYHDENGFVFEYGDKPKGILIGDAK